jgi:hypothetical protein
VRYAHRQGLPVLKDNHRFFSTHDFRFKSIVQQDLTGVETRLKRSILMDYIVAKFSFRILKEHHHERSIKSVSASEQQLN